VDEGPGVNSGRLHLEGVTITPLKRIEHPKGDLLHALKASEPSFSTFGEAYFTSVVGGDSKGWKRHSVMRLNLVVPVGSVSFFVHDERRGLTEQVTIDPENYVRLTVEPGLWMAFRGNTDQLNLVLNLASIEHDPDEVDSAPIEAFPFAGETA
jgi:dTDP-4-dehydrorhamnose 3,5-epimerase